MVLLFKEGSLRKRERDKKYDLYPLAWIEIAGESKKGKGKIGFNDFSHFCGTNVSYVPSS